MDITQTQSATAAVSPARASAQAAPRSAISSDFETFLRMLSTQLQNQDPLNPVDSADYAVQLATFSSVEQQVRTNELLEGMVAQQGLAGLQGYAGWIGLEARSAAPASFDGRTPVELGIAPQDGADRAELVVSDAAGVVVSRIATPLDPADMLWTGTDSGGAPLQAGLYTFELESFAKGESLGRAPVDHYATVTEARTGTGAVELVLSGGVAVTPEAITGLRDPSG